MYKKFKINNDFDWETNVCLINFKSINLKK